MSRHLSSLVTLAACALFLAASAEPGHSQTYVTRTGDQFTLSGTVYKIKGANYYPASAPWSAWFPNWNWTEIVTDVNRLHSLGINSMRINLPYGYGWGGPNVNPVYLDRLERLVELLRSKGMKANITLFDWETSFPAAGTSTETNHKQYVSTIVNRLKNNPGVFVWDVKNEPDHPNNIGGGDRWNPETTGSAIIDWIRRMCAHVRTLDGNHMVSAGVRWYANVEDVIEYEDVAIFHSYWPSDVGPTMIPRIKEITASDPKPILVEEFGWPSQPHPGWRKNEGVWDYGFTESNQLSLYVAHLQAFAYHNIAGCMQWQACDLAAYVPDPNTSQIPDFEHYFGLWKWDGAFKPAAIFYRDNYPASFFPYSDSTIPAAVTNASATGEDGRIVLMWTNSTSADCAGAVVRWSTTEYPTGPTSGNPLGTFSAEGMSAGSCTHTNLPRRTTYYYSIFAVDYAGNYSSRITLSATTLGQPTNLLNGPAVDSFSNGVASGWTAYERYPSGSAGPIAFSQDTTVFESGNASQKISGFGCDLLPSSPGQYAHAAIVQQVPAVPGRSYMLVGHEKLTAGSAAQTYFRAFGIDPTGSCDPGSPLMANVGGARWLGPGVLPWNTDAGGSNFSGLMYRCVSATTALGDSISCWAGLGVSLIDGRSASDKINYDSFFLHEFDNPANPSLQNAGFEAQDVDCNDAGIHLPSGWIPVGGSYGLFAGYLVMNTPTYVRSGSKSACFVCTQGRCAHGLMQRVVVYPGETLTASVWVRSTPSALATTSASIGIDPTGGTDIFAPTVVWSGRPIGGVTSYSQISVSVTSLSTSATVFVKAESGSQTDGYHTVYADDATFSARMTASSPAGVKTLPDGRTATLTDMIVSGRYNGFFHAQDAARTSGVRVVSNANVSVGQRVDVTGTLATVNGERQMTGCTVTIK